MNPTPVKRRRSSSPSTPLGLTGTNLADSHAQSRSSNRPSASPANPTLPPPIPSFPVYAPPGPGPSTWQSWRGSERDRPPPLSEREQPRDRRDPAARRSMDARSPSSDVASPNMEGIDEAVEFVLTRDVSNRAPRSMMACTRCRRQK